MGDSGSVKKKFPHFGNKVYKKLENMMRLYVKEIVTTHGVPLSIVLD